eukprot:987032-Pleurochrysis_carterae.AAC.1
MNEARNLKERQSLLKTCANSKQNEDEQGADNSAQSARARRGTAFCLCGQVCGPPRHIRARVRFH